MFTINKDKFFKILTDLNKTCMFNNIKDKYFMEIPKFNNLINYIDLNKYSLDYMQNRLIAIKNKDTLIEHIKNLIICPIDTKFSLDNLEECQLINFNFPKKIKKSYLKNTDNEENDSYCIKGIMNPSILNAILVYMLNTDLIPKNTIVLFTLKGNTSKFDNDDIIEYFQKYNLDSKQMNLFNVIRLDYTILDKGTPKKDFVGKFIYECIDLIYTNYDMKKLNKIESSEYRNGINYDVECKIFSNKKGYYRKINDYFKIPKYLEFRLFIFSEQTKKNKFFVLTNNEFLVEWNSIEKFINHIYYFINEE